MKFKNRILIYPLMMVMLLMLGTSCSKDEPNGVQLQYNAGELDNLRTFLRQPSAAAGMLNLQQVGLTIADTVSWKLDESWVAKVTDLTWNTAKPNRLLTISWYYKGIAGKLNISNCSALTNLWCSNNQLTALDISKNTALDGVDCSFNQLTALDISNNTALKNLHCYDNQLTALNVSKNTALTDLYCNNIQLTALDISKNTALTDLHCDNNQLTALDVSKNTKLKNLYCSNNKLTALGVSKNFVLHYLDCSYNQLATTALNSFFNTLPYVVPGGGEIVHIGSNPGTSACNKMIANNRGWAVFWGF